MKKFDFFDKNKITNEIIIFGAGYWGNVAILLAKCNGIKVKECWDNDTCKQGKAIYDNVMCTAPNRTDIPVIIAVQNTDIADGISTQLLSLGNTLIFSIAAETVDFGVIPDKLYLEFRYYMTFHRAISWENPTTYSEKLQWLKLNDHDPRYTMLVDKYEVKEYIAKTIGAEYVIPTLGVWENFDDIDFSKLPNRFVLKCTHDSGGLVICKDKNKFDVDKAREKITDCLNSSFYMQGREWPYKNVKPRIICEEYKEDTETKELRDYKFFCFDGVIKALFVATERQKDGEDVKFDFFDSEYNHLPFKQGHDNAILLPKRPVCFDEMKKLAEILSRGIKHVRVDFYEVDGKVFFGEMTFYHHGGLTPFDPEEWDYRFGEWLDLSNVAGK